jgi:hypothetical protein
MPTLGWIGKKAVLNHHRQVPYHLLRCDEKLSVGESRRRQPPDGKVLDRLPAHDGPRVVYGEGCRLGAARMKRESIVIKQVPYEVKVS